MREREGKKKRITGEEHGIFKLKDSLKKKKKKRQRLRIYLFKRFKNIFNIFQIKKYIEK